MHDNAHRWEVTHELGAGQHSNSKETEPMYGYVYTLHIGIQQYSSIVVRICCFGLKFIQCAEYVTLSDVSIVHSNIWQF